MITNTHHYTSYYFTLGFYPARAYLSSSLFRALLFLVKNMNKEQGSRRNFPIIFPVFLLILEEYKVDRNEILSFIYTGCHKMRTIEMLLDNNFDLNYFI